MSHNTYDHNCHGVAADVFMTFVTRHRWQEVRDFFPAEFKPEPMDIMQPDLSWIELRTIENLNDQEWDRMREVNFAFIRRFGHLRRIKSNKRRKDHYA